MKFCLAVAYKHTPWNTVHKHYLEKNIICALELINILKQDADDTCKIRPASGHFRNIPRYKKAVLTLWLMLWSVNRTCIGFPNHWWLQEKHLATIVLTLQKKSHLTHSHAWTSEWKSAWSYNASLSSISAHCYENWPNCIQALYITVNYLPLTSIILTFWLKERQWVVLGL